MVLLALIIYAAAEIAAFVVVAQQIGVLLAVILVLGVSALGPLLLRRVGLSVLHHARVRLARGESPTPDLLDGVVVVLAGVLVCVPGFIGDIIGLALLIGPLRHLVIRVAGRGLARHLDHGLVVRVSDRSGRDSPVIDVPTHPLDDPAHPDHPGAPRAPGAPGAPT